MSKRQSGSQNSGTTKRPVKVKGRIVVVPLTKGFETVVDIDDLELVKTHNWHCLVIRGKPYAARTEIIGGVKRKILLHRVVLGAKDGFQVDHIDGDGLNNTKENLRVCSNQQNQYNRGKSKSNTSGYKGVSWYKAYGKWRATIRIDGKKRHLGYFETPQEAYKAYCKASEEHHKDFSNTG